VSLRMRLLLAITGFVLVGLVVAGSTTYVLLRSYLVQRVDQQLSVAQDPVAHVLVTGEPDPIGGGGPDASAVLFPPGTCGEIVDGRRVLAGPTFTYGSHGPPPSLPSLLPGSAPRRFTTGAAGDSSLRYRVLAQTIVAPVLPSGRGVLVVAIPLTEVTQTLNRLLLVEGLVAAAVLVGLGALSWWTVRRELRPLERIEGTAGAIAAGDLSRRVDVVDPRTEVGRLGRSLNAMLAQIEHAFSERTASEARLRRFLADASHELRTPLTSIRGYSELFRRGAGARPEDLATSMRRIEEESARMGVLVDDLLLLARLDQGRPLERVPVDLARIAADAVDDARAVAPDRQISLESPASLTIDGDELRLREIAANLLSNAVEHTPAGSPIEVHLSVENGHAVLAVRDHGPGLSEDERGAVFEPFYRSDPSRARERGGAGLGLAIVAAIVAAHGGEVRVSSEPGEGATFRVSLPVVEEQPGHAAPTHPAGPEEAAEVPPPPAGIQA
jgi:two-component system, OmpR family, sensor kinase